MAHELVFDAILSEVMDDRWTRMWEHVRAARREMNMLGERDASFAQFGFNEVYKSFLVQQGAEIDAVLGRIFKTHRQFDKVYDVFLPVIKPIPSISSDTVQGFLAGRLASLRIV